MRQTTGRLRPTLVLLFVLIPYGAASPGCREGRAGNANAGRPASNAATDNTNAGRTAMGGELKIRYGSEAEGEGLKVKFAAVPADSRCPIGVTCVWEGDAEVRLEVRAGEGSGGDASTVTLHTSQRFGREARHAGRLFRLLALEPHPRADTKLDPADYVLTLSVTKE